MTQSTLSANWTFSQLTKLHEQQPELVNEALRKFLQNNPELTWSLVINAYLDEEINLGKAAELLDLHELELREQFIKLGIPLRIGPKDILDAQAEVQALDNWLSDDTLSDS